MKLVKVVLLLVLALAIPVAAQDLPEWRALAEQAMKLHRERKESAAIATAEKALASAHQTGDPLAEATVSSTLGVIYLEIEDYYRARGLFATAAGVYAGDARLGPDHEYTAKLYKNQALCAHKLGQEKEAEEYFRKALHAYELLDERHGQPETLDIIEGLADTLAARHHLAEARALYGEVVDKSEPDSLAVMKAVQGLAELDLAVGDYDAAAAGLKRVIAHYSKSHEVKDLDRLAVAQGSLGEVYQEQGDYRAAEALFKQALSLRRGTSAGRPSLGATINNLASLYSQIGDKEQALTLYREALEIHRTLLGEEHPLTATSLNNLALVLADLGQTAQAEKLLRQAMEIERKLHGDKSLEVAGRLSNLAALYLSAHDYAKALPVLQEAAEIWKPSGQPDYATVLGNLASALEGLGRYDEAEATFKKVLKLSNGSAAYTAHNNLAYHYIDTESPKLALEQARKAADLHFEKLQEIFSFTSERQRLSFMREMNPYGLYATLGSAGDLFQTALRYKGAVLDSMVEDQRLAQASKDPEVAATLARTAQDKAELLKLEVLPASDPDRAGIEAARSRVDQGEARLAQSVVGLAGGRDLFQVTPARVQAALPARTVLVEFLYHGFYAGKDKSEKRYSALVVAGEGPVKLVPLGSANEIQALVKSYRDSVHGRRSATRAGRVLVAQANDSSDPSALKALYARLWAPIEKVLPAGTEAVILSPDGELNFVSFATLLGPDDKFLAETLALSYVSSGRDLVLESSPSSRARVALIGAPEFGQPSKPEAANRIVLSPLPGTQDECAVLETVLADRGEKPALCLGADATEARITGLEQSDIMHIATHGLFLSTDYGPENPMSRSGLALCGAQTTLDAWADGKAPDPSGDGFLTAREVGVLDLKQTSLVVLSACDTGLGAAENGEGVLGLRRGFVQSGAANLVFTLWPIDDEETALFMQDFYKSLESNTPRAGLSLTQRAWLARLKAKEGPVVAARLAGPFVLSTRGRL